MSAEVPNLDADSQGWPEGRPLKFGDTRASYDAAMGEVISRLAGAPGESDTMSDPSTTSRGTLGILVARARARHPELVDQPATTLQQQLDQLHSRWLPEAKPTEQPQDPIDDHPFLGD